MIVAVQNKKEITAFVAGSILLTVLWWDTVTHISYLVGDVDAYSHGQLVPFISAWLVWRRRAHLKSSEVFMWLPGVGFLLGAAFLWFAAELFEVKLMQHIAYVGALQALVLTFFGPIIYQRILFPCLFLFLAIPIGHDLIPIMQDVTAQMSVALLGLLGVAYEADGILIKLSSGIYEVAQACAGVRFLFTSLVTGVLLAHLVYVRWQKRLMIILAAVVVPIVANILRVVGILLISEATDQSFAREIDHLIYGWIFLSFILLMLISVAYKFADEDRPDAEPHLWVVFGKPKSAVTHFTVPLLVAVVLMGTFLLTPNLPEPLGSIGKISAPTCDDCDVRNLTSVNGRRGASFSGADAEQQAHYRVSADLVTVSSALYCPQRPGSRLLQIGNLPGGRGWYLERKFEEIQAVDSDIAFSKALYSLGERKKVVWTSYFIGGNWTPNVDEVKWETAIERLKYGVSAGAILVISSNVLGAQENSDAAIRKLLSTFPVDRFLWDEIKPQVKGAAVCAE